MICIEVGRNTGRNVKKKTRSVQRVLFTKEEIKCKLMLWRQEDGVRITVGSRLSSIDYDRRKLNFVFKNMVALYK